MKEGSELHSFAFYESCDDFCIYPDDGDCDLMPTLDVSSDTSNKYIKPIDLNAEEFGLELLFQDGLADEVDTTHDFSNVTDPAAQTVREMYRGFRKNFSHNEWHRRVKLKILESDDFGHLPTFRPCQALLSVDIGSSSPEDCVSTVGGTVTGTVGGTIEANEDGYIAPCFENSLDKMEFVEETSSAEEREHSPGGFAAESVISAQLIEEVNAFHDLLVPPNEMPPNEHPLSAILEDVGKEKAVYDTRRRSTAASESDLQDIADMFKHIYEEAQLQTEPEPPRKKSKPTRRSSRGKGDRRASDGTKEMMSLAEAEARLLGEVDP
eukprot:Platyproteum_vivax@DN10716_c0_g1_i1.p1